MLLRASVRQPVLCDPRPLPVKRQFRQWHGRCAPPIEALSKTLALTSRPRIRSGSVSHVIRCTTETVPGVAAPKTAGNALGRLYVALLPGEPSSCMLTCCLVPCCSTSLRERNIAGACISRRPLHKPSLYGPLYVGKLFQTPDLGDARLLAVSSKSWPRRTLQILSKPAVPHYCHALHLRRSVWAQMGPLGPEPDSTAGMTKCPITWDLHAGH